MGRPRRGGAAAAAGPAGSAAAAAANAALGEAAHAAGTSAAAIVVLKSHVGLPRLAFFSFDACAYFSDSPKINKKKVRLKNQNVVSIATLTTRVKETAATSRHWSTARFDKTTSQYSSVNVSVLEMRSAVLGVATRKNVLGSLPLILVTKKPSSSNLCFILPNTNLYFYLRRSRQVIEW